MMEGRGISSRCLIEPQFPFSWGKQFPLCEGMKKGSRVPKRAQIDTVIEPLRNSLLLLFFITYWVKGSVKRVKEERVEGDTHYRDNKEYVCVCRLGGALVGSD